MTAEEKKAYNNGFILGMASKGVISKVVREASGSIAISDVNTLPAPVSKYTGVAIAIEMNTFEEVV